MDKKLLKQMIKEGYVKETKHPTEDIYIYNYAKKTQYESIWNEVTIKCRGMIMDKNGKILERPFERFFNLGELEGRNISIPLEDFEVYDKLDGSLGILYWIGDKPFIATRGSFNSEQAIHGTEILYKKYSHLFDRLSKSKTYLFEIIYPQNRVVVDYGKMDDIILIGVKDTITGIDLPMRELEFPLVKTFKGIKDFRELTKLEEENKEGFVIKFNSGFRMKIKYDEYVRLHRILTNVSNKSIWELLSKGEDLRELIEKVPDEFYDWVKQTEEDLLSKYKTIEDQCKKVFKSEDEFKSRKELALYVQKQKYPPILFKMSDGKDYKEYVWKLIKPEYAKPFKVEE